MLDFLDQTKTNKSSPKPCFLEIQRKEKNDIPAFWYLFVHEQNNNWGLYENSNISPTAKLNEHHKQK